MLPGERQQDRMVVILPQQPGELLCLAGARGHRLRPAPREQRHMTPVQLHPLAPGVEGLVAGLPIRLAKGFARLAVGVASPRSAGRVDRGDRLAGEKLSRLRQALQRLTSSIGAGAAVEAVAVPDERAEPLSAPDGMPSKRLSSLLSVWRITSRSRAPDSSLPMPARRSASRR